MARFWSFFSCLTFIGLAVILSGCSKNENAKPSVNSDKEGNKKPDDHAHKPGDHGGDHAHKPAAHGGIIFGIGADSYHGEAVFEKNGALRLYTLGADEDKIMEVEAIPVDAFVKAEGDAEPGKIVLQPEPQTGDSKGKTSRFLGQLPSEKVGKKVDVTIPNFTIGKERFRIGFNSMKEEHKDDHKKEGHDAPPVKKTSASEESKLYLEPGGIYTVADIKANDNMTASEKFKGFKAVHVMHPKIGDKICPITETLANPKCTWIVNGKTYEFCCPPCVEEFVTRAKEDPTSIKAPEEYFKKN